MDSAPGPEVLDDLVGAALDGQQPAEISDDVLGGGPAAELAGEVHADQLGIEHFPGQPRHRLAAVRAAHADGDHAEAARVGGVGVGADHEAAREGVVLEHHLVDDAGARLPEPDAVLLRGRVQEVVDLAVLADGALHVLGRAALRPDQVVAVHRAGHRHLLLARLHELQQGHLAGGVLQGNPVHPQAELGLAPAPFLPGEVIGVRDQDLLGQREGAAEAPARLIELAGHGFVQPLDLVNRHGGPPRPAVRRTAHTRIASHLARGRRRLDKIRTYANMTFRRGQGNRPHSPMSAPSRTTP